MASENTRSSFLAPLRHWFKLHPTAKDRMIYGSITLLALMALGGLGFLLTYKWDMIASIAEMQIKIGVDKILMGGAAMVLFGLGVWVVVKINSNKESTCQHK